MKVLVFGNSGFGKSRYARALAAREGLAHLDLDSVVWEPVRWPCSAPVTLSDYLFESSSIHSLLGSLRAATANWFERLRLIARCWFFLTQEEMHAWQTISSGRGSHKYASLELQNTMLSNLQEWVAGYYHRKDAWSYQVHREIFDTFTGPKAEHRELDAYPG